VYRRRRYSIFKCYAEMKTRSPQPVRLSRTGLLDTSWYWTTLTPRSRASSTWTRLMPLFYLSFYASTPGTSPLGLGLREHTTSRATLRRTRCLSSSGRTARTCAMQTSSASATNSRILLLFGSTFLLMKRRTGTTQLIIICLRGCFFYSIFCLSVRLLFSLTYSFSLPQKQSLRTT